VGDARGAVWAALAASVGTLVCCALPSALVLLGLGTTVAAAVSAAPWLVVLSKHKVWVFLLAGALIAGSRVYAWRLSLRRTPAGVSCPTRLGQVTRTVWWISASLYGSAFFVAFVLGPLLAWSDG